ncbi:MAG: hypothetical protein NTY01_03190 [Verrucomicrobia bacterium]|nr:hypothetical protein [Verrucomicrobiota bacterium]
MNNNEGQPGSLGDDEHQLIKTLREEASEVKECFTKFSFQAMGIAVGVLGLLASQQQQHPWVALASILVVIFMVTVAHIGTHKYETSNRNHGYQLHLDRVKQLARTTPSEKSSLVHASQSIQWEEAMRAWRVVQRAVFDCLHDRKWHRGHELKTQYEGPSCFTPSSLPAQVGAPYRAGSYLRDMSRMLNAVAYIALIPLLILALQLKQLKHEEEEHHHEVQEVNIGDLTLSPSSYHLTNRVIDVPQTKIGSLHVRILKDGVIILNEDEACRSSKEKAPNTVEKPNTIQSRTASLRWPSAFYLVPVLCAAWLLPRQIRNSSRMTILEDGMLSIHSSAIIWHAVAVAHQRALNETGAFDDNDYMKNLAHQAKDLVKFIENQTQTVEKPLSIDGWLNKKSSAAS